MILINPPLSITWMVNSHPISVEKNAFASLLINGWHQSSLGRSEFSRVLIKIFRRMFWKVKDMQMSFTLDSKVTSCLQKLLVSWCLTSRDPCPVTTVYVAGLSLVNNPFYYTPKETQGIRAPFSKHSYRYVQKSLRFNHHSS